jgi:hypothetical protein
LTAIEAWVIVCVLFVFGALAEYAGVLLKIKIAATKSSSYYPGRRGLESPVANSIVLANGNTILQDEYSVKFSDVSRRYTYEEVNIKKFGLKALVFIVIIISYIYFIFFYRKNNNR